ncbi:MAG: hypothetical protein JKY37_08310 [Nannocystaceae bacterium]|nr:hypothetical protein [Nannocystaceae bacterium]
MAAPDIDGSAARRVANRAKAAQRSHERVRARAIVVGARVMITRRCHDRRLFLTPCGAPEKGHSFEDTKNFYGYTIARAVLKYGVGFHAATQMGNHHHLNITDHRGNRPNFKNSVHGNLARGFNARFGRFDSFWSGGGSCDTVTPTDDETLEDLAYTDCNPVAAGLLKWGRLWPGFTTYGWRFGESRTFVRPGKYFDPSNPDNPPAVTLTRARPDIFRDLTDDELSDKLFERCLEIERNIQDTMAKENRRFMGLSKLSKSKWWTRAKSPERRFENVPTVASSQSKLRVQELERNADWRRVYALERDKLRTGALTLLPHGAYMLPTLYNVAVADRPP